MKQQKFEGNLGEVQTSIAELETRDVKPLHAPSKKHLWMPELKDTGTKRWLQRSSDEFRRKTRSQALSEKQAKDAVFPSVSIAEVSIETLHSVCAPSVSQQANKRLQKEQPTKSLSWSANHLSGFEIAPYGLPLTSKEYLSVTSEAHAPNGLHEKSNCKEAATEKPSHTSSTVDHLPLEDTWLEIFVEFDNGVDLVVDLDSDSFSEWFMERNSSILLYPDVEDEVQRQSGTDSDRSDYPEGACSGSNEYIGAPSTSTTPQNEKLTTLCVAADCDACSQTAHMGMLADPFSSYKLVEVIDSQESFNSEGKDQGFKFGSFERMPTFFVEGTKRPSADERKVTCNSNWMLLCIGASLGSRVV